MSSMEPYRSFASARGTIAEWVDPQRQHSAAEYAARLRYRHRMAAEAAMSEGQKVIRDAARQKYSPDWEKHWSAPSPNAPRDWPRGESVHQVSVLPPDRSITVTRLTHAGELEQVTRLIVGPHAYAMQSLDGTRVAQEMVVPNPGYDRDDLDAYCGGPHPREALALLEPRCFLHGRHQFGATQKRTKVAGRPGRTVQLRRIVSLSDPRMLGDALNPTILDEAEQIEVVIDDEFGVILEWRGLFDGHVYERHSFEEIRFNEPHIVSEFAIEPLTRH